MPGSELRARVGREVAGLPGLAALLAGLAACGPSITFPDREPTITGDVVGVGSEVPFGASNRIWVKTEETDPCGIVFTIDGDTDIGEQAPDGSNEERAFEDLEEGRTVRVWAGAVAESCPAQATANVVELIPRLEDG